MNGHTPETPPSADIDHRTARHSPHKVLVRFVPHRTLRTTISDMERVLDMTRMREHRTESRRVR